MSREKNYISIDKWLGLLYYVGLQIFSLIDIKNKLWAPGLLLCKG